MKVRLLTIVLFISFLFYGCQDAVWVYVTNNTQDNLEINRVGGPHVAQGETYHVMTLYRDLPQGSFKICRGYGCLATVTVMVEFPPGDTETRISETGIKITEDIRNYFNGQHISGENAIVYITPLDY